MKQVMLNLYNGTTDFIFAMNTMSIVLITATILLVNKLPEQMNRESSVMRLDAQGKVKI